MYGKKGDRHPILYKMIVLVTIVVPCNLPKPSYRLMIIFLSKKFK